MTPRTASRITFSGIATVAIFSFNSDTEANDQGKTAKNIFENFAPASIDTSIEVLDRAGSLGLAPSYDNIQRLSSIIQSRASLEQKKAAARLLGQQYARSEDLSIKNFARASLLKSLDATQSREVQEAIVLVYSRLGFFDDSLRILAKAHDRKIIDDDKYYGDLAHLTILAPSDARLNIFNEIMKSGNGFGAEIVASYVGTDPKLVDSKSAKIVSRLLKQSEPVFDEHPSVIGAMQLAQYAAWIRATANANQVETGRPARFFIEEELSKSNQDPRKLLAFIMDMTPGETLQLKSESTFTRKLKSAISREYKKYPGNEFYMEAMKKLE